MKSKLKKEVKEMYDIAMGSCMDRYASHKRFFTQKEFEANQGKILLLTHCKTKIDSTINKLNN